MYNNLEKKPDHVKRRISFITAVVLTLLIMGVWFTASRVTPRDAETLTAQSSGPLESLMSDIKRLFSEDSPKVLDPTEGTEGEESREREIYFDPERDPGEFDGTVYTPHPRFKDYNNQTE